MAVAAVPGPLTTELGWDPPLPADKVGALVTLRYGTGAGVGIQYAETEMVRDAIRTGVFTDRLPNWFLDVSINQPGADRRHEHPERRARAKGDRRGSGCSPEADRTMSDGDRHTGVAPFGTVVSWSDDPYSRCIARHPIGDQRETLLPPIRAPLAGSVFFAGEHTDDRPGPGRHGGAIKSGYRVAEEILAGS